MELRVARRFRVGPKIAYDADVYSGTDVYTGEEVAIKLERLNCSYPRLRNESKNYHILGLNGNQIVTYKMCEVKNI